MLMISGWYCSVYYALVSPREVFCKVPIALGLGITIYITAVVLSVIKDKI
jgi:hypothetical protein